MDNLYKNGNNWIKDNPNIIIYVELFYTYYDKYIEYEQKRTIKTKKYKQLVKLKGKTSCRVSYSIIIYDTKPPRWVVYILW